jgi:flagellar secretion chaperone FliS
MKGYGRSNALKSYGRMANVEASPAEGVVMLYDGAIKFLRLAASDVESNDIVAKHEHTNRALDIVCYLQAILDFEKGGEVAATYDQLYRSVTAMVMRASAALDAAAYRGAADLLAPVRDAWAEIAKRSTGPLTAPVGSEPQMAEVR